MLGSCRGLVYISNNMSDNGIWNPSTKRFRRLPVCKFDRAPCKQGPGMEQICQGFGYDRTDEDYKVVTIAQWYYPNELKVVSETMVYSLKFGGWKKVQDCPYMVLKEGNGTCATSAGGALYWMMQMELSLSYSRLVLVGLNLGTERFDEVPLPKNMGKPLTFNLAALNECLCLISGYGTCRNGKNLVLDHIDVWMMRGCGVEQSWVKLFTVEQLEGRQHFSYLRPIAYSVTGREVLLEMDKRKFLWFSLEKKSLKHSKVSGGFDTFDSFVTLGTLVPLYYGGGDEKDGKKGVEEQDDSVIKEMK